MRLSQSIVGEQEAAAVARVICEDGYLGMGRETMAFEKEIAEYLGIESWQVVSANSGTASLHLAVWAAYERAKKAGKLEKIKGRPSILAPTLTFISSFQAIVAGGCKPVPCDINPETGTLDLEDAARRITPETIGIMHVDYASNPWNIEAVNSFAARHGIAMIDDAAHAFGCRRHGKKIGSFGDLTCFSFDGIKNITCGEGGCLVAFDKESAQVAADARLLGVQGDTAKRFAGDRTWEPDATLPGLRYHMSNIMAAIGRVQLKRLENEFIPARRHLWGLYTRILGQVDALRLLETDPDDYIVPHIMPVRILFGKRDLARKELDLAGIPTGLHYRPNHLLTMFGNGRVCLPEAEKLYSELLTLPLHPGLSDQDVEEVCAIIVKALD